MSPIDLICLLFSLPIVVVAAYQLVITMAAFAHRAPAGGDATLRLAVVVPAHNEELQIEGTVARLIHSDYPDDLVAVIVLADNCSDGTAEAARTCGAEVIERTNPERPGKGHALHWLFEEHRDRFTGFDGVVLIDADALIEPDFLIGIAASLARPGVEAVQGWYRVANPGENWRAALTFAGFALVNHLRPMGRSALGGTADLKGCGLAFSREVVLRYGYPAYGTAVEDTECGLLLLLEGIRVAYNPRARVESDMPTDRDQAEPQRRRWEGGRGLLARRFLPRMMGQFLRTGRWQFLDAALDLATPPLSLFVALQLPAFVVTVILSPPSALLIVGTLAATSIQVFAALYLAKAPASVWAALVAAPLFLLWKIPMYLRLAIRPGGRDWDRTARRAELERDAQDKGS